MQQMIERLLSGQEQMMADRKGDREVLKEMNASHKEMLAKMEAER
jgi:hypothetical protein